MLGQMSDTAAGSADLVKETTMASFREDVLTESMNQPVLVDFWAPWCGPCKQLAPLIEKVVKAAGGKVKLVKMNIDEHPQVAGQLGIKSIPAVVAFQNGRPADGFVGALPEGQIKDFIERLVGPVEDPTADLLAEGELALSEDRNEDAAESFASVLEMQDDNVAALAGLAKALLAQGLVEEARGVLDSVPANAPQDASLVAARAALDLAVQAADLGDIPELEKRLSADPKDNQSRFDLALAFNARGRRQDAADALLHIIKADRSWEDDRARQQLLQFFEAWGPMDPDTAQARRKLSTLLFS